MHGSLVAWLHVDISSTNRPITYRTLRQGPSPANKHQSQMVFCVFVSDRAQHFTSWCFKKYIKCFTALGHILPVLRWPARCSRPVQRVQMASPVRPFFPLGDTPGGISSKSEMAPRLLPQRDSPWLFTGNDRPIGKRDRVCPRYLEKSTFLLPSQTTTGCPGVPLERCLAKTPCLLKSHLTTQLFATDEFSRFLPWNKTFYQWSWAWLAFIVT